MQRVLNPDEFRQWFKSFLPGISRGEPQTLLKPATVSDRSDPKLVHLDGLNLSRAWCMREIASVLAPRDLARRVLAESARLHAADALAQLAEEAGMSLIHMALAFVINHPAVTAAIIGPRTMEQLESQLGAADVQLEPAVLDRIDEIVAPGQTINPVDAGWTNPALDASARRR